MKLELKHLAPYLPHKLKVFDTYSGQNLFLGLVTLGDCGVMRKLDYPIQSRDFTEIKPILHPLSNYINLPDQKYKDLNIDLMDQIYINELALGRVSLSTLPYGVVESMAEHHIDFFRLIDKGLAIDINTIKNGS